MPIDANMLKKLRDMTGAGYMDCKKALEEAEGNMDKASEILRKKGFEKAQKYMQRETKFSKIASYVHRGRIGVLLEMACETDFVGNNAEFDELMHDICLQITGAEPIAISKEDVPKELVEEEKKKYQDEVRGKPPEIAEKIIEGKLQKNLFSQKCLLEQTFINEAKFSGTIAEMIKAKISKFGENIFVVRFVRYESGMPAVVCEARRQEGQTSNI